MSLRVQKGGTVFKPMAKARPRAGGDGSQQSQSSTASNPRSSAGPTSSAETSGAAEGGSLYASTPPLPPASTHSRPPHSSSSTPRPEVSHDQPSNPAPDTSRGQSLNPPQSSAPRTIAVPSRNYVTVAPSTRPSAVSESSSQFSSTSGQRSEDSQKLADALMMPPPTIPQHAISQLSPTTPRPPAGASANPIASSSSNASTSLPPPSESTEIDVDFATVVERAARAADSSLPLAPHSSQNQDSREETVAPEPAGSSRPRRSQRAAAVSGETTTPSADEDDNETSTKRRRSRRVVDSDDEASPPPKKKRTAKRRSRTATSAATDQQDASDGELPKKKRQGRRRTRTPAHFDGDADPGEDLDPTVVTMADLCEDTGQGRVSSKAAKIFENHANWKRANRERRARMRAANERKKYGLKEDDEAGGDGEAEAEGAGAESKGEPEEEIIAAGSSPVASDAGDLFAHVEEGDADDAGDKDDEDEFDYSAIAGSGRFAPQFRIGPNGETIIDDTSLHVDRNEEHETEAYQHIEESDATKFTNSGTYGKKVNGSRWSAEETELFFDALRQFGENYELISYVLPGRDRKQCKNKFKAEDKKNSARIDDCLKNRTAIDMQTLSRMTGKDFSGPTPVIRAKTPPNLAGLDTGAQVEETDGSGMVRKQSSTPGPSEKGGKRAGKKKANAKADDGVEILGSAADGVWDSD